MNINIDLPEMDNLFYLISSWDFYKDLVEEKQLVKNLEDDVNILLDTAEENKLLTYDSNSDDEDKKNEKIMNKIKNKELEPLKLKYSSVEEYTNINYNLFQVECKSQISRAKLVEMEPSELHQIKDGKVDKKFFLIELVKSDKENTESVYYSGGDLIVLSFEKMNKQTVNEQHAMAVIDKITVNSIIVKVSMNLSVSRIAGFVSGLKKGSTLYVSRICNLATSIREYQALMSVDSLSLLDQLLHPGQINNLNIDKNKDFFNIPNQLKDKIESFFDISQVESLYASIKKRGVTLIQGPPGTGKSTTILGILSVILNSFCQPIRVKSLATQCNFQSEHLNKRELMIKQQPWIFNPHYSDWLDDPINTNDNALQFKSCEITDRLISLSKYEDEDVSPPERVLVCAPSNVAIDEIVRKIVNLGIFNSDGQKYSPKFIRIGPNYHPSIKEHCLDYIVQMKSQSEEIKDIDKLKQELLLGAKIICSTLSIAGSNTLLTLNQKFDTVIIDEAGQSVEVSSIIPLKYNCERLILVGDPKQLNATVFSRSAMKYNYDLSLFRRFQESGQEVTILKTQYRMHPLISKFISETFYDGKLIDSESVKTMNEPCYSLSSFQPFVYYDIESKESFDGNSFFNESQVLFVIELVAVLMKIYSLEDIIDKIAIISPYSSQVLKIKIAMRKIIKYNDICPIEVNTVDGFQGKEKRIIIFSTVRSKGSKSIGFLKDEKRMNVGLSRAQSSLIVIGDSKKLILDENWEKLVKYSYKNGLFYKVSGGYKEFLSNLESNDTSTFRIKNDEEFVRAIYSSGLDK